MTASVLALFVLACATPVFHFAPDQWSQVLGDSVFGVNVLFFGWLGIFSGVIAWYANLLLPPALALIWFDKPRTARWFALAGFAIALTSLFVTHWQYIGPHAGSMAREIHAYGVGFYAWLCSFGLLTIGAFWLSMGVPVEHRNTKD